MSFFLNIREVKPFRALPPGALKARIRMRLNDWARVYIKYSDGVRVHIIGDDGEFFYVGEELCQGLNADASFLISKRDGVDLIAAERHRQRGALGWDAAHDDEHSGGEIARAASCYADIAASLSAGVPFDGVKDFATDVLELGPHWPWEYESWKPSPDPVRNLEKAGALIAAEIDRLKRKTEQEGGAV